ncbi:MAG: nucleotidyltransferase domain-containing protein, partial [Ignavibacteria bacterium]|nr:nucleotidyltransferase domain-containing protein [Ignavibacteria bacterium]
IKEFKKELKNLYGEKFKKIILFGSYAKGKFNENSDIDLVIVLKSIESPGREIDRMIDIITEINLKYNVLLSVVPVSINDYKNLNSPLLINIRKEGITS